MAGTEKDSTSLMAKWSQSPYNSSFNAEKYTNQWWATCDAEDDGDRYIVHVMTRVHHLLESEKFSGKKLLDLCSGPSLYGVISASKHFSEIYLTDYADPNREALRKWLKRDPGAHDWSPFFRFVANLEHSAAGDIEERLRSAVKGILPCNLLDALPLGPNQRDLVPVDAVFTFWTLEVVVQENMKLEDFFQKFANMLKPGGFLLMLSAEFMSWYHQEDRTYPARGFPQDLVRESLDQAGFGKPQFIELPDGDMCFSEHSDEKGEYLMYCFKI